MQEEIREIVLRINVISIFPDSLGIDTPSRIVIEVTTIPDKNLLKSAGQYESSFKN